MLKIWITSNLRVREENEEPLSLLSFDMKRYVTSETWDLAKKDTETHRHSVLPVSRRRGMNWGVLDDCVKHGVSGYVVIDVWLNNKAPEGSIATPHVSAGKASKFPDHNIVMLSHGSPSRERLHDLHPIIKEFPNVAKQTYLPLFALTDDELTLVTLMGMKASRVVGVPRLTEALVPKLSEMGELTFHNHLWSGNSKSPTW